MTDILRAIQESDVVYRLGWSLVHTLWLGLAVGAAVAIVLWLLPRRSAQARYLAGCAALGLMLMLPVGAFLLVPPNHDPAPASVVQASPPVDHPAAIAQSPIQQPPEPSGDEAAPGPVSVSQRHAPAPAGSIPSAPTSPVAPAALASKSLAEPPPPTLSVRFSRALAPALPWIVAAWLAGVLVLSMWQLAGWIAAHRLKRLATCGVGLELAGMLGAVAAAMRVTRPVKALESMLVRVPTVIGWLRPVILLPVGIATGLAPEQLRAILAHELAHIRRYDYLVNLLQSLVETLLFYHPVVWLISRQIRIERENCCDDIAVAAGAERFSYAQSLLQLAQRAADRGSGPAGLQAPALGATGRPSMLRRRIGRLLGASDQGIRLGQSWPLALAVLGALLLTTLLVNVTCSTQPDATGQSSTQPATPSPSSGQAQTVRRELSILKTIELVDKDDLPAGLYCEVLVDASQKRPGAKWVYEYAIDPITQDIDGWFQEELSARLAGVYTAKGTIQVAEQFLKDKTVTIRLRYIAENRDMQRPDTPMVRFQGTKQSKSVYLRGTMPNHLSPGKYTVNVELDEYQRKGDGLVPAMLTTIRHRERLSCTFTVPPAAAQSATPSTSSLRSEHSGSKTGQAHPALTDQQAVDKLLEILSARMPKDWAPAPVVRGKVNPTYWDYGKGIEINLLPRKLLGVTNRKPDGVRVWIMGPDYAAKQPPDNSGTATQTWPAIELAQWRGRRIFIWPGLDEVQWTTLEADLKAALAQTDPSTPRLGSGKASSRPSTQPEANAPTLQPAVYFDITSGQGLDLDHARSVDQSGLDVDAVLKGFQLLGRGTAAAVVELPYEIESDHLTAEHVLAKATRIDQKAAAWPLKNNKGFPTNVVFRTAGGRVGAMAVVGYTQTRNGDVLSYRVKCRLLSKRATQPAKAPFKVDFLACYPTGKGGQAIDAWNTAQVVCWRPDGRLLPGRQKLPPMRYHHAGCSDREGLKLEIWLAYQSEVLDIVDIEFTDPNGRPCLIDGRTGSYLTSRSKSATRPAGGWLECGYWFRADAPLPDKVSMNVRYGLDEWKTAARLLPGQEDKAALPKGIKFASAGLTSPPEVVGYLYVALEFDPLKIGSADFDLVAIGKDGKRLDWTGIGTEGRQQNLLRTFTMSADAQVARYELLVRPVHVYLTTFDNISLESMKSIKACRQADSSAKYGHVIERTLGDLADRRNSLLDLDTGEVLDSPADTVGYDEMAPLFARHGIDLGGHLRNKDHSLGKWLWSFGTLSASVSNDLWETATPADMDKVLSGKEASAFYDLRFYDLPATFALRTAEGGRALLQVLAVDDPANTIRLRYKLLPALGASYPATAPTTAPAGKTADGGPFEEGNLPVPLERLGERERRDQALRNLQDISRAMRQYEQSSGLSSMPTTAEFTDPDRPQSQPAGAPVKLDLSRGLTEEALLPHVGGRVTVTGFWNDAGKSGACVCAQKDGKGARITILATSDSEIKKVSDLKGVTGAPVEVTGTLRRLAPRPPLPPPADPGVPVAQPSDVRFYFDAKEADVKFTDEHPPATATRPADGGTTVTEQGVTFNQTVGPYDVTSGYVYDQYKSFLTVRDKASRRVLLDVKPGEFPAAKVPNSRAFWDIEGKLCIYGEVKSGQGYIRAFDLSRRRIAYEIPADALGPGEMDALRFIDGRLYLSGNVDFKGGWVQLRQADDGRIIWKLQQEDLPGWITQSSLVGRRLVMCGKDANDHGWIEARDFAKGGTLWSATPDQHAYPPQFQAAGIDKVVVLTYGQGTVVTCLDAANGQSKWKAAVKPMLCELVVKEDVVLAQGKDRAVAMDLSDGHVLSDTVYERKGKNGPLTSRPAGTLSGTFTAQERKAMEALDSGWQNPAMQAMSWTMCHCASEAGKARFQKMFDTLEAYGQTDIVGFRAGGGAKGITDSFHKMLDDDDPVMRAFAAIALATTGQHDATKQIAKVMKGPSAHPKEWDQTMADVFGDIDRDRAAIALGILGAKEYADDMAAMLSSKNANTRSGAALGLGYLKADRYAKAVSSLLGDPEEKVKICAMNALDMMGARGLDKEIAALVGAGSDPSVSETACFALANLGAAEQAPKIATLLTKEFKKGYAARALAVLGASQYAKDIAKLLDSSNSLDRRDACLALGLLGAKEQEGAIAQRLKDPEGFVKSAAAFALVLMNSTQYAPQVVPVFEESGCYGLSDLRLPKDREDKIQTLASNNFKAMKASASTRPGDPARKG